MSRRPPRSTRTDPLFPYTTHFRSTRYEQYVLLDLVSTASGESDLAAKLSSILEKAFEDGLVLDAAISQSEAPAREFWKLRENASEAQKLEGASIKHSSEERRVGEECVSKCRSRWSADHLKKK